MARMKVTAFWTEAPLCPEVYGRFRGTCCPDDEDSKYL
jgi:hypothetical protein